MGMINGTSAGNVVAKEEADAGEGLVPLPVRAALPVRVHPVGVESLRLVVGDQAGVAGLGEQRAQGREIDLRGGQVEVVDAEETPGLGDVGHDLRLGDPVPVRALEPPQPGQRLPVGTVEPGGVVGLAAGGSGSSVPPWSMCEK